MPFEIKFIYNGPTSVSMKLPSDTVTLATGDIDALILQLTKFRMQMTPEIERTLQDGQHGAGVVDPIWQVRPHIDHTNYLVRHHGIGWISFLFPHQEAKKLASALQIRTEMSNPQPPTDRPH